MQFVSAISTQAKQICDSAHATMSSDIQIDATPSHDNGSQLTAYVKLEQPCV